MGEPENERDSHLSRQARRGDGDGEDDSDGFIGGSGRARRGGGRRGSGGKDDNPEEETAAEILEEPLNFEDLPKPVKAAVIEQCPGAGRFDAVRFTEGKSVWYNVIGRRGRIEMSVSVSEGGEVMEYDIDIAPSRLPKAVRATLEKEYGHAEFDRVVAVTSHIFELQYETDDGMRHFVQLDATGKVLADIEEEAISEDELDDEPFGH